MRPSGWCSDYRGRCTSEGFHHLCQTRITAGQLNGCGCQAWGGHHDKETSE